MRTVPSHPRLLTVALGAALLMGAAHARGQERSIRPHTYEFVLANHSGQASQPVVIEGTELRLPLHYGLIEVRRGSSIVAIVQMHQIQFVANRTIEGERVFLAKGNEATHEIEADRMEIDQNGGMILFWVEGDLVAVLNPNSFQVVADRDARVGSATEVSR